MRKCSAAWRKNMPSPAQRRQWSKRGISSSLMPVHSKPSNLRADYTFTASRDHKRPAYRAFLAEFKQIEVTIIGGRIDHSSRSPALANMALNCCKIPCWMWQFRCNSWDLERVLQHPRKRKAALKRDLIAHASRKILLADSSQIRLMVAV